VRHRIGNVRSIGLLVGTLACIVSCQELPLFPDPSKTYSAPTFAKVEITPSTVLPGDPFAVSFTVTAVTGIAYVRVVYQPTASASFADSVDGHGEYSLTATVSVPSVEPYTNSLSAYVQVIAVDKAGRTSSTGGSIQFDSPGYIGGSFSTPVGPGPCDLRSAPSNCAWHRSVAVVGDTLTLAVGASSTSPSDVAWLGYGIGTPINARDSVVVHGKYATATLRVLLDSNWVTGDPNRPVVSFFARDARGHRWTDFPYQYISVLKGPRRQFSFAPLGGEVHDVLLDTLRGVLYLAQPDSNRVVRLHVSTMSYDSPIVLPGGPNGIDLSLGGDSLFVAMGKTFDMAIVNLVTSQVSRIPVWGWTPNYLREATNGKILIAENQASGAIIEHDLRTGQQRRRFANYADYAGPLIPIGGRDQLVFCSHVYDAVADTATRGFDTGVGCGSQSTDLAGRYILIGCRLWTSAFTHVRDYDDEGGPSVIALDASEVFFGTPFGLRRVRRSDGMVLEDLPIVLATPDGPMFSNLVPLPGNEGVLAVSRLGGVVRVDLRSPSPSALRGRAAAAARVSPATPASSPR